MNLVENIWREAGDVYVYPTSSQSFEMCIKPVLVMRLFRQLNITGLEFLAQEGCFFFLTLLFIDYLILKNDKNNELRNA